MKETYRIKLPKHINIGDPWYYEKYKGADLQRLTVDFLVPRHLSSARVMIEETPYDDMPEVSNLNMTICLAPKRTIDTYLGGMYYEGQECKERPLTVDTAKYMINVDKNAITDFKKSKNGILFASGSMWEGVDCVGDCLSSVIIVRLPFPMRSALMEEKKDTCDTVAEFIDRYCTPNMLIKLRQGVGRLIRSETDTGVVSILDPRATSKSYAGKIGQALHKYPRVDTTEEVAQFMRSVKNDNYYAKKENNQ